MNENSEQVSEDEARAMWDGLKEAMQHSDPYADVQNQDRDLYGDIIGDGFLLTLEDSERASLESAASAADQYLSEYLIDLFVVAVSQRLDDLGMSS